MSATLTHPSVPAPLRAQALRFGAESARGERVHWLLKRNCSVTPRQMMGFYLSLCVVSLAIAAGFWFHGATLVIPFTSIEVVALGLALVVFARHAGDREDIVLQGDRLTVACTSGTTTRRAEFAPAWVRVEPAHGDGSLIELSGQGQRIAVGRYVRPELRRQLADELRWALRRWPFAAQRDSAVEEKSEN